MASPSYAAFKLLRVYRHGELPHPAWDGYRIIRGVLVTPEGRELSPVDMGWIGLLVGRAKLAGLIARERDQLRATLAGRESVAVSKAAGAQSGSAAALPSHGFPGAFPVVSGASWQGVAAGLGWGAAPIFSRGGLPSSNRGVSETERIAGEAVPHPSTSCAATLPEAGVAALSRAGGAA